MSWTRHDMQMELTATGNPAMEVASDHDLCAYDAYFPSCAREHRCPLIALDRKTVLDKAYLDGAVRIKRRGGKVLVVRPEERSRSPLDVGGMDLKIDRSEMFDSIVAGGRKAGESSD